MEGKELLALTYPLTHTHAHMGRALAMLESAAWATAATSVVVFGDGKRDLALVLLGDKRTNK